MATFKVTKLFPANSYITVPDAKVEVIFNFTILASMRLKELLESKHLYQKVSIDPAEIVAATRKRVVSDVSIYEYWANSQLPLERLRLAKAQISERGSGPTLVMQNIKLYCKKCDGREAFVPAWYKDFASDLEAPTESNLGIKFSYPSSLPWGFQLLLLVYQCQSCQGIPEALLVRRTGWDLELHGRSPMEFVEVPKFIPKPEYGHFRDSVIAFNTGKTLAAIFYLRTFIEQFARRVTNKTGRVTGDEIMDAYNETLPAQHRDSMPSLREWYDKLSVPIHEARDDADTYSAAREQIEQHFRIRDVFKIPESATAVAPDSPPVSSS
jgi:hypothetical protein